MNKINYINIDLDLSAGHSLDKLDQYLISQELMQISYFEADSTWKAWYEINECKESPEETMQVFWQSLKNMPTEIKLIWESCNKRAFNIGFDCGKEPWAYNQTLSTETLSRVVELNAEVIITIYPEDKTEKI